MESWTDADLDRAEFCGLLVTLDEADWPDAARDPSRDDTDGMCKLRKLYLDYNSPEDDEEEDEDEEDWDDEEDEDEDEEEEGEGEEGDAAAPGLDEEARLRRIRREALRSFPADHPARRGAGRPGAGA
jgi:hypothetical protein